LGHWSICFEITRWFSLQEGLFLSARLFIRVGSSLLPVLLLAVVLSSCKGFFVNPTLSSISIQPPSPLVEVGKTEDLQAWGTYSDDSRSQITSGVVWSSSDISTVSIDTNSGVIQGESTGGTATITAAAQGLSATATATAYLGTISNFEVCQGTFNTGTCPASTWSLTTSGGYQYFYAKGTYNGSAIDLTTSATWTPSNSDISCDNSSSPATCTVSSGISSGSYTIIVTYGTSYSATLNINVS
jgi:trimeric autotransporter adhesin